MSLRYRPSPRFGEYVRKIIACGHWEDAETAKGNHIALLRHTQSGRTITYQIHDGGNDINGPRNMAKEAQDICGCKFIEARGRKVSRKAIERTGFDPSQAARANARWADKWGGSVDRLWAEHDRQAAAFCELARNPSRATAAKAPKVLAEIREIEAQLTRFGQPIEPFSLTDIEESA